MPNTVLDFNRLHRAACGCGACNIVLGARSPDGLPRFRDYDHALYWYQHNDRTKISVNRRTIRGDMHNS